MAKLDKEKKRNRRVIRVRKKISGTPERPRLTVHRSLRQIYAQLVDDTAGVTIATVSSLSPDVRNKTKGKTKTEVAEMVGQKMAEIAKEKEIEAVVFDRHGYLYHGRIKAVAEGARKGGLTL